MNLLPLIFLVVGVIGRSSNSSSRGSGSSRTSLSSSNSHSSTNSHSSSSSSSSKKTSSSSGWFSFGNVFRSKSPSSLSWFSRWRSSKSSKEVSSLSTPRPSRHFASSEIFGRKGQKSRERTDSSSVRPTSNWFHRIKSSEHFGESTLPVTTTMRPGRFQRIREKISDTARNKIPGLISKAKEKLRPKLPMIAAAAKKHGPKVAKFVWNKLRGSSTPRPMAGFLSSTPSAGGNSKGEEIFIPYNDDFLAECPEKVDAFLQLDNISFIFEDHHMFLVEEGSLNQTSAISDLFTGVGKVDASVFDSKKQIILLFKERKVYGFEWNDSQKEFQPTKGFPKDLPDSIKFTPSAAFTWHDGYPVIVSNSGEYAVYDSYWNKEITIGDKNQGYLEGLPLNVKGVSDWDEDKTFIFTEKKVYQYDFRQKKTVGEAEDLGDFLDCFLVDIPSE